MVLLQNITIKDMKQYIKNGEIKSRKNIVVRITKEVNGEQKTFQVINPTEDMILADGWVEYVPEVTPRAKSKFEIVQELVTKQWNDRTDISNAEALDYAVIVYDFEHYIGQELAQGKIVSCDGKLWRVRQAHTCQADWAPSLDSASLWEVIEVEHEGTEDDPIPYNPPMEIFSGKYYTEENKLYECTRDSGTVLTHSLSSLIGLYVKIV